MLLSAYLCLLCLLGQALADRISVGLPLSAQDPPAARTDRPYSFTVSRSTFSTDSASLTYTALNLPSWLVFDASSLILSGTPSAADVGSRSVRIAATTRDGNTASDSLSIPVEVSQGVTLTNSLADQFNNKQAAVTSAYTVFSGSSLFPGVRVPPGWSFSIGFLPIFTAPNRRRVYYSATSADGSPIPEWLHFNENTITFDGIAPSPSRLQQLGSDGVFKIRVGGSDVRGYMDQYQDFTIRISLRTLEQVHPLTLNLTAGYPLREKFDLLEAFRISGRPVNASDITDLSLDSKSYAIDLDNETISGSPPAGYVGRMEMVYVKLTDQDGNNVNATLGITFFPSMFTSDKPEPIKVTAGDEINVSIRRFLSNSTSQPHVTATFADGIGSQWLNYDEAAMQIRGRVPSDVDPSIASIKVNLLGENTETNTRSYSTIELLLKDETQEVKGGLSGPVLAGIIVAVVLNCILAAFFVWMCIRRRRRLARGVTGQEAEGYSSEKAAKVATTQSVAGPIYRPESFTELRDLNDVPGAAITLPASKQSRSPVGSEKARPLSDESVEKSRKDQGWHKRASTLPSSVLAAFHLPTISSPGSPNLGLASMGFATPTSIASKDKHQDSPASNSSAASRARKFLVNPFGPSRTPFPFTANFTAKADETRPKISNPIMHPSFSNAAFQAQLAIAVDEKGIVHRGGTYEETSASEFSPSGTYLGNQTYGASSHFTLGSTTGAAATAGHGTTVVTETEGETQTEEGGSGGTHFEGEDGVMYYMDERGIIMETETEEDMPTSEYTAKYSTTDVSGLATSDVRTNDATDESQTDSQVEVSGSTNAFGIPNSSVVGKRSSLESANGSGYQGSDRASWESDAPFVWNTELGGEIGDVPIDLIDEYSGAEHTDYTGSAPTEEGFTDYTDGVGRPISTHTQQTQDGATTEYEIWTEEGGESVETENSDPPVQRSDFRPIAEPRETQRDVHSAASNYDDSSRVPSRAGTVVHPIILPGQAAELTDADFSIDNIHFPTESDIARTVATEASTDASELDTGAAIIQTASRISARHTLDSPMASSDNGSPGSDCTERMHSPVVPMQSRLVSFGKQKTVVVTPSSGPGAGSNISPSGDDRWGRSQVAVVGDGSPGSVFSQRTGYTDASGETTPQARPRSSLVNSSSQKHGLGFITDPAEPIPPLPAGVSASSIKSHASAASKGKASSKQARHSRSSGFIHHRSSSSTHSISRSRSPTPPMPESFPSLPALPTAASLASAKSKQSLKSAMSSKKIKRSDMAASLHSTSRSAFSHSAHSARSSRSSIPLPPQTRVLLGVNEPFHFYPPLLLSSSPTGLSTTTAFTQGTTYTSSEGKPITPDGAEYTIYEEIRSDSPAGGSEEGGGEIVGLEEMPGWLHWEDMELWGVPGDEVRGRWEVRVVESRRDGSERVVGRFALERAPAVTPTQLLSILSSDDLRETVHRQLQSCHVLKTDWSMLQDKMDEPYWHNAWHEAAKRMDLLPYYKKKNTNLENAWYGLIKEDLAFSCPVAFCTVPMRTGSLFDKSNWTNDDEKEFAKHTLRSSLAMMSLLGALVTDTWSAELCDEWIDMRCKELEYGRTVALLRSPTSLAVRS